MAKGFLFLIFLITELPARAQNMTPEEYISKYENLAIAEQQRAGVPAAITLAQGLLETQSGNSDLFKQSNNHFGIKCKSNWSGPSVQHDDDKANECFRAYSTDEESYRDHSDFLRNSPRYAFLFRLSPTDYKGWARGLRRAGYATNPRYAGTLINYIEKYNLEQYTEIALVSKDKENEAVTSNTAKEIPGQASNDRESGLNAGTVNKPLAAPSKSDLNAKIYIVEPKEGLYAVARKWGVTVPELREWNQLQSDNLQIGQKLIIYQ